MFVGLYLICNLVLVVSVQALDSVMTFTYSISVLFFSILCHRDYGTRPSNLPGLNIMSFWCICSDSATPRAVACWVTLSMDSPGMNTGLGSHSLLLGIFWTQRLNPGLPHYCHIINPLATREALSSY